jgi:hypothetical protein
MDEKRPLSPAQQFAVAEAMGTYGVTPDMLIAKLQETDKVSPEVKAGAIGMAVRMADSIGRAIAYRQPPEYNKRWAEWRLKKLVNEAPDDELCRIVRILANGGAKAMSHRQFVAKRFRDLLVE